MTLKEKIEKYTGAAANADIDAFGEIASNLILNKIPLEKARLFSTQDGFLDSTSVSGKFAVLMVENSYDVAKQIPPEQKKLAAKSGSIYEATETAPVYYIESGTLYLLPNGAGTITSIPYPTFSYSNSDIAGFPKEYSICVILQTAIYLLINKLNTIVEAMKAYSLTSTTVPTAPTAPSFTYTDAALGTYVNSLDIITTGGFVGYLSVIDSTIMSELTTLLADLKTFVQTEEDFEKSDSQGGLIKAKYEQLSLLISEQLNKFNSGLEGYKSELEVAIEKYRTKSQMLIKLAEDTTSLNLANEAKELERQISEYASKIQKYMQEINSYGVQVQNEVAAFTAKSQKSSKDIENLIAQIQSLKTELNSTFQLLLGA